MTKHHRVARDYYNSSLSLKEITSKHNLRHEQKIHKIIKEMEPEAANIPNEDKVVLVLDRNSAAIAKEILSSHSIDCYIPDKFHLTEMYESKFDK